MFYLAQQIHFSLSQDIHGININLLLGSNAQWYAKIFFFSLSSSFRVTCMNGCFCEYMCGRVRHFFFYFFLVVFTIFRNEQQNGKKFCFFRFGSNEFRQVSPTSSDLWSIMFLLIFVLPFNFDFFISGWNQMTEIYIWCTHTHTHTHTHTQIYYVHL